MRCRIGIPDNLKPMGYHNFIPRCRTNLHPSLPSRAEGFIRYAPGAASSFEPSMPTQKSRDHLQHLCAIIGSAAPRSPNLSTLVSNATGGTWHGAPGIRSRGGTKIGLNGTIVGPSPLVGLVRLFAMHHPHARRDFVFGIMQEYQ